MNIADPHASTLPPPPSPAAVRLGASLIGFSLRVVDNDLALANARAAARGFYDDLLEAQARIAELEAENARLRAGR